VNWPTLEQTLKGLGAAVAGAVVPMIVQGGLPHTPDQWHTVMATAAGAVALYFKNPPAGKDTPPNA